MRCRRRFTLPMLAIGLALFSIMAASPSSKAETSNRAGLVIDYGGAVTTQCVEFAEPEISGYDLLVKAGLDVSALFNAGMGAGICRIGDVGCDASNCFCGFPPNYWSYWHVADGGWQYSLGGASAYRVHDGDVDGWTWGPGSPPPVHTFDQICAAATSAVTSEPSPTAPVETATPAPPTEAATLAAPTQSPASANPATAAASATITPTVVVPVSSGQATSTETAIPEALTAQATAPATATAANAGRPTSYIIFAVMAVVLIGALVFMWARRR